MWLLPFSPCFVAQFRSGRVGNMFVSPLPMTYRSKLQKKCSLSRTIGPPMVPPY